jgi:hypothetical protein
VLCVLGVSALSVFEEDSPQSRRERKDYAEKTEIDRLALRKIELSVVIYEVETHD